MLLELIPAEDDQTLRPVLLQHDLDEFFPEGAGPAGHQNCFFRPIHPIRLATKLIRISHTRAGRTAARFLVPWQSSPSLDWEDAHRLDLALPASITEFPRNRLAMRHISNEKSPRIFALPMLECPSTLQFPVRNNSLRDRPASSTRDFVVRVQNRPLWPLRIG